MERRPRTTTINHSTPKTRTASQRVQYGSSSRRTSAREADVRSSSQRSHSYSGEGSGRRSSGYSSHQNSEKRSSGYASRETSGSRTSGSSSRRTSGKRPSGYASREASGSRTSGSSSRQTFGKRPSESSSSARKNTGRPSSSRQASSTRASASSSGSRRTAALRKKRKRLLIAIAVLTVIIAVAVIILISSLTVNEPEELQIESSETTQILSWKGNTKRFSYQVFRKDTGSEYELVAQIPLDGECSYVSSDLASATQYDYKVIAVKGSDENARESEGVFASAYTLPETLSNCSAMTLSKDSLTLSWTNPQTVSGYEISFGTDQNLSDAQTVSVSPSEIQKNETTGQETYQIPNLTVGSTYYFKVRCFCGTDVYSEWSDVFSGKVTQAVDMTGIDINKPMVALTFDDGPDKGDYTNRILDVLKANGSHATFFQLGHLAEIYPDVVQRIVNEGSEIGCHTYDHGHMGNEVTSEDIIRANDAIEKACGVRPTSFRCPGGSLTDLIRSVCESEGQPIFHWSVDTRDWASRDADAVMSEVENQGVNDGDIILLHNIYESSAAATERLVPWLINQGFQVVSASQLIQAKSGAPAVPGTQYFSATNFN